MNQVVVTGPDIERNLEFANKYFGDDLRNHPQFFHIISEKILPEECLHAYLILEEPTEDWMEFYMSCPRPIIMLKEF